MPAIKCPATGKHKSVEQTLSHSAYTFSSYFQSEMDKSYACPTCQLSFVRKQQLRRHIKSHRGSSTKEESSSESSPVPPTTSNVRVRLASPLRLTLPRVASSKAPSTREVTCDPNPLGLPLDAPNFNTPGGMDDWLDSFFPGFGAMLQVPPAAQDAPHSRRSRITPEGVHLGKRGIDGNTKTQTHTRRRRSPSSSATESRPASGAQSPRPSSRSSDITDATPAPVELSVEHPAC